MPLLFFCMAKPTLWRDIHRPEGWFYRVFPTSGEGKLKHTLPFSTSGGVEKKKLS